MNPSWFAGRLRELREAKGWTREQLAEAAGLKAGGIRDLELSKRWPTWATVLAVSKALGVDCTAFTQEPADREPQGPGRPLKVDPQGKPGKTAGTGKATEGLVKKKKRPGKRRDG